MKTLALRDGDLFLTTGGYQLYSGVDRIRQDLTLALREEFGSDRFHPKWGSIILRYIGQIQSPHLEALVRAEINRVLQNYIAVQQAEVLRDSQVDVKNRFTTSDVVRRVTALVTDMQLDRINVALSLETLSREVVKIKRQVAL